MYLNRAGSGEREYPNDLSDFERELWEPVKILRSLRFTGLERGMGLERGGSDEELSQIVVQIVHLEFADVCSDGRGKDES
jgi:hypothetical protein